MLDFDPWYRAHGVRTLAQVFNPPLTFVADIELPRKAVLHWPGAGPLDSGPGSDELIFKKITRPIPMWFLPDLTHKQGGPRRVLATVEDQIRTWRNKNRRFRPVREYEMGIQNANVPFVCNYAFAQRKYAYVRSLYAGFNRFYNVQKTVWDTIKTRLDGDQQHFIIYQLPTKLPPLDILKQLDAAELDVEQMQLTMMQLKYFTTPEQWLLAQLWMWAGISRQKTWWSDLKPEQLFKINLIFQRSGQWTAINLGMLNKHRAPTKLELEANPDLDKKGADAKQFRLVVLRGMMSLMSLKSQADGLPNQLLVETNQGKEEASSQAAEAPATPDAKEMLLNPPQTKAVAPDSLVVTKIESVPPKQDPTTKLTTVNSSTRQMTVNDYVSSDLDELDVSSIETELEKDLSALDKVLEAATLQERAVVQVQQGILQPDEAVKSICDRLADQGGMTAAEYRRHLAISQTYKSIVAPDGKSTLADFIKIPQEILKISEAPKLRDNPNVLDKTMLKSSLIDFDERYIKTVMERDIASMVMNVQQSGYSVIGYKKERVETITGSYDHYHVRIQPVEGEVSVLPFRVPVINEDGVFTSGGVRYTLRKQLTEIPIRKIDDATVALTSYYGKTFVARSQKRVNDWGRYIRNQVMVKGLDREDPTVSDLKVGRVFQPHLQAPRLYSTLAQDFRGFTAGDLTFNFDRRQAMVLFGQAMMDTYEQDGAMLAGKDRHGRPIVIGKDDALYVGENGEYKPIGTIEQLLQLPMAKVPLDFVELKLMGKTIPLGLVLGHAMGLSNLCHLLGVEPRRVPAGKRVEQSDQEYSLVFNDETLVFNREDRKASLILAGFNEYHRTLRDYSVYEFDRPDVYLNVLETNSLGARYLRELELMEQMFVDPITRDLLVEMGEPVSFRGLLLRSTEMLLLDYFPTKQERTRGYERIAGAVYSELVRAIRSQRGRPGRSRMPVDLNPHAVWQNIARDPSVSLVSDINPIQNLKEQEAITYYGTGGRGSRSMTRDTRVFRESDMGVISESTVDSGDVGVNMYVSADPMWTSLRGLAKPYDHSKKDPTSLLSTSALLAPASDRDDPKRTVFVSVQHGHGVACDGYEELPVRTGYEEIIGQRTGDLFSTAARQDGVVKSVDANGIIVEFADGTTKGIELGRRYGEAAGLTVPHEVKTNLKAGDQFKAGDNLAYNDGFFAQSADDPTQMVWKGAALAWVALMESTKTLEDASSISHRIAKLLTASSTKTVDIVVPFDYEVHKVRKVGEHVDTEDILCIIEDAVTSASGAFDEESLDTLRAVSAQIPLAKAKGQIERLEVFYHGDREDMSGTLRALTAQTDREMSKRYKAHGRPGFTGSTDESFRVDGEPLGLDMAVLRFYITGKMPMSIGD